MPVAIRIAVSAALLGVVLWQVDWRSLVDALARSDWAWLLFALLAFNGSMIFTSMRWKLIDNGATLGNGVRSRAALAATYVSLWLSNFLPTAFGGDLARILASRQAGARLPVALSGAVLDRYVGLTTLAFVFAASETLAAQDARRPLLAASLFFALGFALLLLLAWKGAQVPVPRHWLRRRPIRFAARATAVLRTLGRQPSCARRIALTSVAATLFGIAAYWGAIRPLGSQVALSTVLAAAALGTLASVVPISISGWGVREGTVAFVLSESGALTAGDASLAAIFNGMVIAVTSLAGFAISLSGGWHSTMAASPANLARPGLRRSQEK